MNKSGFKNNWRSDIQSCGPRIIEQITDAIHAETGLTRQQCAPLLLGEMRLQPKSPMNTGHDHATHARRISVLNEQIQS